MNEIEDKIELGQAINIANAWFCKASKEDVPDDLIFTELVLSKALPLLKKVKAEHKKRQEKGVIRDPNSGITIERTNIKELM